MSNGAGHDILVTIPPSFWDPWTCGSQRTHCWILGRDVSIAEQEWSDRARAVRAVLTYFQGLSAVSAGFFM